MSANGGKPAKNTPGISRDQMIDQIYGVAMDPTRYEDLLDHWESMIEPFRSDANGTLVNIDLDAEYAIHFNRADEFLDRLEDNPKQPDHLSHVGKAAAFLIGRDMRIADRNQPAGQVFMINKGDKLSELPIDSDDLLALEKQTAAMLMSNGNKSAVFRTQFANGERLVILHLQTLHQDDAPPLVVAISSEISWPSGFDSLLASTFNLTQTEIKIAKALSECQSLHEIANIRGRAVDTIRSQLKSILAKTDTNSQTELVRLILSMMDIASYTVDIAAQVSSESTGTKDLKPRPFHVLNLRDGRKMDYLILGDPNGKPCLYFPQDYGLVRWPAPAEAEATRRGIKIIVQLRPGYGNSSHYPKNSDIGPLVADDTAELLDHLGVASCPIVSLGADIFYAAWLHKIYPGRVRAVIACASSFPMKAAAQYERMHKWHRFIMASARYTPRLLPFMVKAGFSLARRLGKRGFLNAIFGDSDADVATFEIPENFEAIVCGSEVCLSETHSAHRSFSTEVIALETVDWTPVLENLRGDVPVYSINGLQDPQVPAETLREFQQKHPWIDFREYEDAGQLVFFKKWHDVIPLIEKYL